MPCNFDDCFGFRIHHFINYQIFRNFDNDCRKKKIQDNVEAFINSFKIIILNYFLTLLYNLNYNTFVLM